jgi:signal transduction histidine kinase
MATAAARPRFERDTENAIVAGLLAGLARRLDVDPLLVRIVFGVLVVVTSGAALVVYVIAWPFVPADHEEGRPATKTERWLKRASSPRRLRLAAGVGLLTLATLLVFRELGIWWSDAVIWPLVMAASGAALLWAQSRAMQPGLEVEPESHAVATTAAETPAPAAAAEAPVRRAGAADLYRGGFGVALVVGAGLLFLSANDALGGAREAVLVAVAAIAALALILAPFLWRLGRNLAAERAERIRSQERAELAAHLHDSVLQTLTLMQKRADNPREVATLARRQERELRSWLFDGRSRRTASLATAIEDAAAEVEDAHGVPIEVVVVGDLELDERAAALVAATREALTNAAKFAGDAGAVAVYAEMQNGAAQVFVRDRGAGFDPERIPDDRRGVRESIVGRMERHGGKATVRSTPGSGTEIELTLEAAER